MITIAMPAAMRPYSMAVAPDSFSKKRVTNFFIGSSRLKLHPDVHVSPFRHFREHGELRRQGLITSKRSRFAYNVRLAGMLRFVHTLLPHRGTAQKKWPP